MNTPPRQRILQYLKRLGPYFALALALPGGFLLVLFIWLYQHRHRKA